MVGQVAQVRPRHRFPAGTGRVGICELQHPHGADPVPPRLVLVLPGLVVHAETGQNARGVEHIRLVVSGLDPDGVQLKQFPALVLIGMLRVGVPVVQIRQHRRVQARCDQQVLEPAQAVRTDHVLVVRPGFIDVVTGHGDVEVVRPELLHHGQQLPTAPRRPHDVAGVHAGQLTPALALPGADGLPHLPDGFGLVGQPGQDRLTFPVVDRPGIQLLGNPCVRAARTRDLCQPLWARSVSQPAQYMAGQICGDVGVVGQDRGFGTRVGVWWRSSLAGRLRRLVDRPRRGFPADQTQMQLSRVDKRLAFRRPDVGDPHPLLATLLEHPALGEPHDHLLAAEGLDASDPRGGVVGVLQGDLLLDRTGRGSGGVSAHAQKAREADRAQGQHVAAGLRVPAHPTDSTRRRACRSSRCSPESPDEPKNRTDADQSARPHTALDLGHGVRPWARR